MIKVSPPAKLKTVLLKEIEDAIEEIIDRHASDDDLTVPWIGDKTFNLMAQSALNVLMAMSDHEQYIEKAGLVEK